MDISTTYLGLKLRSPIVPSASPLSEDLDNFRRMEDAGAGAIVMHSLFAEQITHERYELHTHLTQGTESFPEALSYFPEPDTFQTGPDEYLKLIRKAKEAVGIPIIASLNGSSVGAWTQYAALMQEAGADAIELNIYRVTTDPKIKSSEVEAEHMEILMSVRNQVKIPVAVKLSPFFSNMANMAQCLDATGANGLVLFNRFYQPDIDLELLEVRPRLLFSTPQALRLPMRWIAILHGRVKTDLAATGGIHTHEDVLKMLMVGADVTMMCSALLSRGISVIKHVERDLRQWMKEHDYESVDLMKGSMSQRNTADPDAYERAQYMRALKSVRPMV